MGIFLQVGISHGQPPQKPARRKYHPENLEAVPPLPLTAKPAQKLVMHFTLKLYGAQEFILVSIFVSDDKEIVTRGNIYCGDLIFKVSI